jgi:hypothetical protein
LKSFHNETKSNRDWSGDAHRLCFSLVVGAPAQTIIHSFDGDSGPTLAECQAGPSHCGRQPEMNVAANGKQVMQVSWHNVSVYDYDGKLLQSTPLASFIRRAGMDPMPPKSDKGPFEPHIVFDEFIGRWIITSTCKSDCLLVSATSNPLGPWGGVYLSCLQGGPCLDYDPEYAILLTKIVNGELSLLIDPSGQGDQYKPEGIDPWSRFQNALSQAAWRRLRWCVIMKIEFLDVTVTWLKLISAEPMVHSCTRMCPAFGPRPWGSGTISVYEFTATGH